jgi:hypothetical protein
MLKYNITANMIECVASLKGQHITITFNSISNLIVTLALMETNLAQSGLLGPPLYDDITST